MTIVRTVRPEGAGVPWWAAILAGGAVGAIAVLSLPAALGAAVVVAALVAFLRSGVRAEIVVGLFWIAFTVYETVFADVTVPGFFYPFYAAFLAVMVGSLVRTGVRVPLAAFLTYAAFMVVVAASFVGFADPIGFDVLQRVIAYLFGAVVLLQIRSERGLAAVLTAGVVASLAISIWVIASAIQGGFTYRGDIDVDQNVVAFFVGFGVVILACICARLIAGPANRALLALLALLMLSLGATLYASLLLASRGMVLALAAALALVAARAVAASPRTLWFVAALVVLAGAALALPGGQGLLERFEGERIETGGSRVPVWEETLSRYGERGPVQWLVGHGFGSSRDVVQRRFGTIASTHNAYLQVLYEFGLIGMVLFLALHVHLLLRSFRVRGPYGPILFGLIAFLVGANVSTNAPDGFMYWVVIGTCMAMLAWVRPAPAAGAAGGGTA